MPPLISDIFQTFSPEILPNLPPILIYPPTYLPPTFYLPLGTYTTPCQLNSPFDSFSFAPLSILQENIMKYMIPPTTISQFYKAFRYFLLLSLNLPLLYPSSQLTPDQFSRVWIDADATARDLLVFMWYTKDIILPLGYIELHTGSPPFYLSRFSLQAISLIHEHHILFTSNLGYKIPEFKPYSTVDYHTIKDLQPHKKTLSHKAYGSLKPRMWKSYMRLWRITTPWPKLILPFFPPKI